MKIAQICPHFSPYTEKRLVGIKKIIYLLYQGLLKKGHEVYIIAPSDSDLSNKNVIPTIPSLKSFNISVYDPKSYYYGIIHAGKAAYMCSSFDIVHNHAEQVFLPFIPFIEKPVISTIHGSSFSEEEKFIFKNYKNQFIAVAISKQSIKVNNFISFTKHIYNGVDTNEFLYKDSPENYMFLLSRINPIKGLTEAIEVSLKTKCQLIICGYKEPLKEKYYEQVLNLSLSNPYLIQINKDEICDIEKKLILYQNARLFLFPIQWEEPFGLVMIESMACGTPVVAFARGSVPEVIKDGETGFIVNPSDDDIRGNWIIKKTGIEGLCEAVERIYSMPEDQYRQMRRNCRAHVEKYFTVERMVDEYEKVYYKIINEK